MVNDRRLAYLGSIVLGLNDALVELIGVLAGLTFAFQDSQLIAATALITGLAASFSMGASEYLSQKMEENESAPTSAIYAFFSYLVTVAVLITPFLLLPNSFVSLAIAMALATSIIGLFSFYVSVVKESSFGKRFTDRAATGT